MLDDEDVCEARDEYSSLKMTGGAPGLGEFHNIPEPEAELIAKADVYMRGGRRSEGDRDVPGQKQEKGMPPTRVRATIIVLGGRDRHLRRWTARRSLRFLRR